MTTPPDPGPFHTDAQLQEWLAFLLNRANQSQLWLLFLDEDDRPVGPFMPCDDLPPGGHGHLCDTEDLGSLPFVELLGHRFATLMREFGFAQAVLVWERRGRSRISDEDRAWAAIGDHLVAQGARVRARFVLHDHGLRILTPDDLLTHAS